MRDLVVDHRAGGRADHLRRPPPAPHRRSAPIIPRRPPPYTTPIPRYSDPHVPRPPRGPTYGPGLNPGRRRRAAPPTRYEKGAAMNVLAVATVVAALGGERPAHPAASPDGRPARVRRRHGRLPGAAGHLRHGGRRVATSGASRTSRSTAPTTSRRASPQTATKIAFTPLRPASTQVLSTTYVADAARPPGPLRAPLARGVSGFLLTRSGRGYVERARR